MSHLFEEFSENDPQYIDFGQIESDDQRDLRERFSSFADWNAAEIARFDPYAPGTYQKMRCTPMEKDNADAEPRLTMMLAHNMFRSIHLGVPKDEDDPRFIKSHEYINGSRVVLFSANREDGSLVPVYFETDKAGMPTFVCLMSFHTIDQTALRFRDLSAYRSRLVEKLNIGERAVSRFAVDELKSFNATLDDILTL